MSTTLWRLLLVLMAHFSVILPAHAAGPWGSAQELEIAYPPAKVVFDVTASTEAELTNIIDRISMLNNFYATDALEGKIVVVVHGDAIPFFTIANFEKHKPLMTRAQSLTLGDIVEVRLCRAAAKARYGLTAKDFHGFIKMVPMADAEIIRLQHAGFAYMH